MSAKQKTKEQSTQWVIQSEAQQKAYLHPLRMKIMGFLAKSPMTISQVAEKLQVHPANITHHFRLLEGAELIFLAEERDLGRVVERYFRAVAQSFDVMPPEGAVTNANAQVLNFLRNDLSAAIGALKGDDEESVIGLVRRAKINPKKFKEFSEKLESLIREFGAASSPGEPGAESYALNVSLYPHGVDYGSTGRIEIRKRKKTENVLPLKRKARKK